MSRRVLQHLVRHRIGSVAEPRRCLRQRERGALGLGVVGGFSPRPEREDPRALLTKLLERARVHVDANAASIDLTDAKVDELERRSWNSAGFRGVADRQQAFAGTRYGKGRALYPRLHGPSFLENGFLRRHIQVCDFLTV